jgi:hypothetical protein
MSDCIDHLEFTNEICPDCGLPVDEYGNTEADFKYCCFPDCGCDGSRLCMAPNGPSENSCRGNIEGMWHRGSDLNARKAVFFTIGLCSKRKETK